MPSTHHRLALLAAMAPLVLAGCGGGGGGEPGPPAVRLRFDAYPVAGVRGQPLGPVRVVALDANGGVARGYAGPVTVTLRGGDPAAVFSGTTTARGRGTFLFTGLAIDRVGRDYRLRASGPGLPEVDAGSTPVGLPPQAQVGAWPFDLRVADLDGDGKPDVVTANFHSRDLSVVRGNGDGTLGPTATLPLSGSPNGLAIADLDGDGHLDLAVSLYSLGELQLLRGRGDGTFDPPAHLAAAPGPGALRAADMNGDGHLDLVVGVTAGAAVLPGRGDGSFGAAVVSGATGVDQVEVADLDEDGLLDVIFSDYLGGVVGVMRGDGHGALAPAVTVEPGPTLILPASLVVADLLGDGHLDVAVTSGFDHGAAFLRGDGTGALTWVSDVYLALNGNGDARAGDLDGDGLADLAVADFSSTVTVLRRAVPSYATWYTGARAVGLALADMNGDGALDAVTSNDAFMDPGSVSVLLGTGDGTFSQ